MSTLSSSISSTSSKAAALLKKLRESILMELLSSLTDASNWIFPKFKIADKTIYMTCLSFVEKPNVLNFSSTRLKLSLKTVFEVDFKVTSLSGTYYEQEENVNKNVPLLYHSHFYLKTYVYKLTLY